MYVADLANQGESYMNRRLICVALLLALATGAATAQDAPARGGSPLGAAAKRLVSLDVQGATAQELSTQLSALAGVPVVYASAQGNDEITLQVQDFPLGALVANLAKQGGIAIGGRDFMPAPAAGFDKRVLQQRVTVSARDVNAQGVSSLLTGLLGTPVEWRVADAGMKLNLDLQDMAVQDVLRQLGRMGELSVQGLNP
jgi:hypothetical protein